MVDQMTYHCFFYPLGVKDALLIASLHVNIIQIQTILIW